MVPKAEWMVLNVKSDDRFSPQTRTICYVVLSCAICRLSSCRQRALEMTHVVSSNMKATHTRESEKDR